MSVPYPSVGTILSPNRMRAVDQEFLRPKGFIVLTCNYVAEHSDTARRYRAKEKWRYSRNKNYIYSTDKLYIELKQMKY